MSIDEEIAMLKPILSHPAGFDVDMGGTLCIRPITECSPPIKWEVDWEDSNGESHYQEFDNLDKALELFVSLRHAMEWGLDFEAEYYGKVE